VNRMRAPRLAGGASWSCPFPPEADVAGVNQAAVALRVSVGASGSVSAVQVTSEPGYGFGRAAKRCAMSKRWDPGLDASGRSVDATAVVNVRFVR
jgi:periplasmic protein TonB